MSVDLVSKNASTTKLFAIDSEISSAIALGSGFNKRTKKVLNLVAEGNGKSEVRTATGAQYFINWCENYSELSSFFGLSASASYDGGVAGGSASVNMVRATKIQSSSICIAVSARIVANLQFFPSAALRSDALNILQKEKLLQFVEKFGGTFAQTLYFGGELACILEISASQSETIEQLRVAMELHGWGAKGQAEMEQSLRELTRNRSVIVKYCQSGGSVGRATGGIVVSDVAGVISRMKAFISEVWGTNGLDGSTVPLNAELASVRTLTNWPPDQGDPEQPFPDEIEQIAKSALLLKDRLILVEDVLRPGRQVAPSTIEIAKALLGYLTYVNDDSAKVLGKMMRGSTQSLSYANESFYQYRIRKLLDIDPGVHENVGSYCDFSNNDANQFLERVFGKRQPELIQPWPKLKVDHWWGYQGSNDGALGGVHVQCIHNGGSIEAMARALAGNPKDDEGVLIHYSSGPDAFPGGHCGNLAIHMIAVRTVKADASQLEPLPLLPDALIAREEIIVKKGKLNRIDNKNFQANFVCTLPFRSCGKYILTVTEFFINDKKIVRQRTYNSYWLKPDDLSIQLRHTFLSEPDWEPKDFDVEVVTALKMEK